MSAKGQHIVFSTLFFLFLFFLAVTLFINYLFLEPQAQDNDYERLQMQATRAADNLIRSGYPEEWDETTVQRVGIVDDGKLNRTKLATLEMMTTNEYQDTKRLLGITEDYLLDVDGTYLGDPRYADREVLISSEPSAIATIKRIIIDEDTENSITMTIYVYTP